MSSSFGADRLPKNADSFWRSTDGSVTKSRTDATASPACRVGQLGSHVVRQEITVEAIDVGHLPDMAIRAAD